jgi:hypothetical protein
MQEMIVGAAAATSAPTLYARPKPVKRAYVRNTRAQRAGITAAVDIKTEKQSRNRGEKLVGGDVDADRTRRNRRVEQRTRGRLQLVKSRSPGRRTQDRPSAEPGQPTRGGDEHCISLHPDCHCFEGRCAPDRAAAASAQASISPRKAAVIRSGVVETVSIERAEADAGLVAIHGRVDARGGERFLRRLQQCLEGTTRVSPHAPIAAARLRPVSFTNRNNVPYKPGTAFQLAITEPDRPSNKIAGPERLPPRFGGDQWQFKATS